MKPSLKAAQERYMERQRNAGNVRVTVLVPAADRYKLVKYAAQLRSERR